MKISRTLALLLLSAGLLGTAATQALAAAVSAPAASTAAAAATSNAYFRFPAIRGDTVVFTAEGDLWKTSVRGGQAERLTTHPGYETNAAISRDGLWVAFSASYEGAQEAYVMPLAGGCRAAFPLIMVAWWCWAGRRRAKSWSVRKTRTVLPRGAW